MSKSYKSEGTHKPERFLTPQQEYDRGLRRRPKTFKDWEDDDDEDLTTTDNTVIDQEEE